jgi:hypothetical protein
LDSAGQGHYSEKNNIKINKNATLGHKNIENHAYLGSQSKFLNP